MYSLGALSRASFRNIYNCGAFFHDAGSGVCSVDPSRGSGTATFTRATVGWTKLSTGLWASVASGSPRSFYSGMDTTAGSYVGYLAEGARTNSALHGRKIAAGVTALEWTESNVTAADDATGIDGVANSCSTLTATMADGTILQARTIASAAKTFSAFVRRKTGTGAVYMTLDNDATRTEITSLINSTTYTRVSATQTLANPTFGFKLATSGDEIEVDMVMLEDGASFASTPIPTTTAAVTRNADVLTYPASGNIDQTTGTLFVSAYQANRFSTAVFVGGSAENRQLFGATVTGALSYYDGTNNPFTTITPFAASQINKGGTSWTGSSGALACNGSIESGKTFDGGWNLTAIEIGGYNSVSGIPYGPIAEVRIYDRALSDAELQALTT